MKKTALTAACLMVLGSIPVAQAAESGRANARKATSRVVGAVPEVLTTIVYDTGINAGFHPDVPAGSPNLNRTVGNRFNSFLGGPLVMTGMVSMLTVFPANGGAQSVSIASAPTPGNTAMVLDYINANMVANQFNAVNVAPPVTVGPDFLGIFLGAFTATQPAGLLGMSDMQTMAQGYHAFQAFYVAGGLQTMIEVVPNRNAMLRATGDPLPVELIDFKIQ